MAEVNSCVQRHGPRLASRDPFTTLAHTTSCPRITRQPILTPPIIYIYITTGQSVLSRAQVQMHAYTDSTICLYIGPTAPSPLLKWVTMSFKLISIFFILLAITHQSLCGQNISLVTYTYLFKPTVRRLVVMVLAIRILRPPYSSTACSLTRSTLCTILFLLSSYFALVAFNILLRFDTTTGPCFAFLFS